MALDTFDGRLGLTWDVKHADPTHVSLSAREGCLTITTQEGWCSCGFRNYKNLFLTETPATQRGDFGVTTCLVGFKPAVDWHQAGLVAYDDDENYFKFVHEVDEGQSVFTVHVEIDGDRTIEHFPCPWKSAKLWVSIERQGSRYSCLASRDGRRYRLIGEGIWLDSPPKYLGLLARNGPAAQLKEPAPGIEASFDFFEVRELPPDLVEAETDPGGFVELFNGTDLTGWEKVGPGDYTVEDGLLRIHGGTGEMGFLWHEKELKDFVLVAEWKVASVSEDSGIFVRFPEPERPAQVEAEGYEVQILDSWDTSGTGALIARSSEDGWYSVVATVSEVAAKEPGEWNILELTVAGQEYTVTLNGVKVVEFTGDRHLEGHVGIQSHPDPAEIYFRSIRYRELTDSSD